MLPMLKKHTVITAALLATLSISACGKKKDVIAAPPQDTQTQTGDKPAPKVPNSDQGDTNGKMGGGLPDPNGGADTDYKPGDDNEVGEEEGDQYEPTPLPDNSNSGSNKGSGHSSRPSTRPNLPPPVVETEPVPTTPQEVPRDYVVNDANNVENDNYGKRYTGGVAADGLLYTSSSTDELLNFLRARNSRVGERYRRLNIEAAASVTFAKMSVDSLSGDGIVTLKVKEYGKDVVYNLAGSSASGPANPLRLVRAGNGEKTTGSRLMEGTWKCVDFDGGCENVFVRAKIGGGDDSAIINVVFRNSKMDLWFSLPGESSGNPEYLRLYELAINTIKRNINSANRLRYATMNSWEVVNGRSGVTLSMKAYNNELLAFAGPLLAPEAGTGVNIVLSRLAQDKEDSLDLIDTNSTSLRYQNFIADARLVANNGLGQVRVKFKMRKRADFTQDQFAITFMRRIKPLVELNDENLK
ncbi:hypothetical protein AZI86_05555 [Bdellovibrio bacteriovorus]|uniref:Lipoprotein n=1 Tax=Bdellovibrio bacteriovorus TaxID=959 RepID=A0A150WPV1_BDEBC|nr:hypothetical protein [Bdellovibrio bacteriovorus]KYG66512.1 hypothetical protein AZI86_05555 [Bdellovibrio bacteriovorus]